MYCVNCGNKIEDGMKFCPSCGKAIGSIHYQEAENKNEYDGAVKKCPRCGEVLKSFETKCSSCGYELRSIKTTSALEEFTNRLSDIDNEKSEKSGLNYMKLFVGDYFDNLMEEKRKSSKKASYIRSFAIPNSKEDLFEFIIMASANIQPNYLRPFSIFRREGLDVDTYNSRKSLSEAWLSKMKQAYEKARLSFKNDEDFEHVKEIYESKLEEINKK